MDLNQVQVKLDSIMSKNELVPKLALIEIIETDVENLINEVEDLKKQKDKKRFWFNQLKKPQKPSNNWPE